MNDKQFLYEKLEYNTFIVSTNSGIDNAEYLFNKIKPKYVCYDTETTGLNNITDTPFLITFGFDKYLFICDNSNKELFNKFINKMLKIISNKHILLFAHNAKYDRHMLLNNGTIFPEDIRLADTMTLARLITSCDNDFASMSLSSLGEQYVDKDSKFGGELIKSVIKKLKAERKKVVCENYKLITGDKSFTNAWDTYTKHIKHIDKYHEAFEDYKEPNYYDVYLEEPKLMINYAFDDIVIMLEFIKKVMPIYLHKYTKNGTVDNSVFFRENELISYIGDMERVGFTIDLQYLINSHYKVEEYKNKLYGMLHTLTGESWRVGQHEVIKDFFFSKYWLVLPNDDKKTISGLLNNESQEIREIAKIIMALRTVDKWLSTYIDGILNKIIKVDDNWKLFTNIKNNGTVSGRVSSDLQQMPKVAIIDFEGNELFHPRKMVIVPKDTKLFFLDFSQVELRVQAFYTILTGQPDYNLCRAYMPYGCINIETYEPFDFTNPLHVSNWNSGKWINNDSTDWIATDMHSMTTHNAFPELIDENSKEFKLARYLGKMTNFSCNYGVGVKKLSDQLEVDMATAQRLRTSYNTSYPGITNYGKNVNKMLTMKGYVENLYGRKYYIDNSSNYYKGSNYLIQGSCADSLKAIEIEVCKYLKDKKSKFIMPIHDELIFEVVNGEEYIIPEIKKIMEDVKDKIPYIPIICDIEYTDTNWGEKQDYEI